ncbi:MAG: hypothetical protein ABSH32_16435 [Bryobacteraceae bacterium]
MAAARWWPRGFRQPHQFSSFYALDFEAWHRPLTQNWPFAQHLPLQQVSPGGHAVLPQQVLPLLTQNGVEHVVQQVCVPAQVFEPQQTFPLDAQNGLLPVVQQIWAFVEQQRPPVPHAVVPLLHFGTLSWPAACLIPTALSIPTASAPLRSFRAWRRGNGLASMRAMSSRRKRIFPVLSFAQAFMGQCCDGVGSDRYILQNNAIFTNQKATGVAKIPYSFDKHQSVP